MGEAIPTYEYGQEMVLTNKHLMGQFPERAFIVSKYDMGYLIMMSEHFPFQHGVHKHFMVHVAKLSKWWTSAKKGVQTELFADFRKKRIRDTWRKRHIKTVE